MLNKKFDLVEKIYLRDGSKSDPSSVSCGDFDESKINELAKWNIKTTGKEFFPCVFKEVNPTYPHVFEEYLELLLKAKGGKEIIRAFHILDAMDCVSGIYIHWGVTDKVSCYSISFYDKLNKKRALTIYSLLEDSKKLLYEMLCCNSVSNAREKVEKALIAVGAGLATGGLLAVGGAICTQGVIYGASTIAGFLSTEIFAAGLGTLLGVGGVVFGVGILALIIGGIMYTKTLRNQNKLALERLDVIEKVQAVCQNLKKPKDSKGVVLNNNISIIDTSSQNTEQKGRLKKEEEENLNINNELEKGIDKNDLNLENNNNNQYVKLEQEKKLSTQDDEEMLRKEEVARGSRVFSFENDKKKDDIQLMPPL